MTNQSEPFGRLLRGAINSIAAYEGKSAAAVEEDLGAAIGISRAAIQRYKAVSCRPSRAPPRFSPRPLCSAAS